MSAADWGFASELDDVGGAGRDRRHRRGRAHARRRAARTQEIAAQAVERALADAGSPPTDVDGIMYTPLRGDAARRAPRSARTSAPRTTCGCPTQGGGMVWAGTAPYDAARAIRAGRATHVVNTFSVAWATQRAEMIGGPGEVHAAGALQAEPRGAVRLVPAAGLLRHDRAPPHARVRHDRGAARRDRRRVPAAREPDARRRHARQAADARAVPREPACSSDPFRKEDCCLISDGGARVRHDLGRARARSAAGRSSRCSASASATRSTGAYWSQQGDFTATPQVFAAPGAFAMAGLAPADVDVLACYDPFTIVSLMQIEDMGFCPKGEGGALRRGRRRSTSTPASCRTTRTAACCRTPTCSASRTSSSSCASCRGEAAAQVPDATRRRLRRLHRPAGEHARAGAALMHARLPAARRRVGADAQFWAGAARGELRIPRCDCVRASRLVPGTRLPQLRRRRSDVDARERTRHAVLVGGRAPRVHPAVRGAGAVRHRAGRARRGSRRAARDPHRRLCSRAICAATCRSAPSSGRCASPASTAR